ncbi:GH36-type glycosyl hydrolase domain-containing protein [Clostridium thermarum]|uniref:GH36-type glycosyl hydrolase domain-containing protein n=1 Tax=Clostridium thermarum TaxID=1716543 RepID=UPI0013D5BE2C|nr:cellobiose phosphorylase [Clostridium thermarum]
MSKKTPMDRWFFENNDGEFTLMNPHKSSGIYFPLANEEGMMSSITPLLAGDIKTDQNTFLMEPVSVRDLHNSQVSRNFWLNIEGKEVWSAVGNSLVQRTLCFEDDGEEEVKMEAGFLWHRIIRSNSRLGVKSEVTNFVPVNEHKAELMKVTITNNRPEALKFTPTTAVPIYGRSADNLRDHRHVTSLLHRINLDEYGVIVTPTLSFDERGHKSNNISYSVQAVQGDGTAPVGFFPIEEEFIGEGGSLLWPEAVVKNLECYYKKGAYVEGREAIGAVRFEECVLKSGESISYIVIMAISENIDITKEYIEAYGSTLKFDNEFIKNKEFWNRKLSNLSFKSSDSNFDLWMKWVELQPILRRIYGCSFLPHHDYGRGGRGWRDLWQDCLALLLLEPEQVRELLYNNYAGVRVDGSNATIIGSKPGEFIADRNNISRTWMDHGAWPYITTKLYLDLSGDLEFLLEEQTYFKDKQCCRSSKVDERWDEAYGNKQKDETGKIYKGSILEHMLIQQITAFYNVGEHNNIMLEGADWNDAFDMAPDKGESVAFTALYGSNLLDLSKLLLKLKEKLDICEIELAKEMLLLIDSFYGLVDYNSVSEKNQLLNRYFELCKHNVSGEKVKIEVDKLSLDLERKALWIMGHIRENEWIQDSEGFQWFNGYYDNESKALEGGFPSGTRMTLTGQVFPVMSGTAEKEQVEKIIASVNRYLKDTNVGGIRLNTNFNEVKLNMGRGFGFAYGHKENGAMFSHMTIMYINALYKRGYAKEGFEILDMIYKHCIDFEKSRILPGIPEYINEQGRGMYHYLTGAASWLLLTLLSEVYGVKGSLGDLMLQPKLMKAQFDGNSTASVLTIFRDKKIFVEYKNESMLEYGEYKIGRAILDERNLMLNLVEDALVIDKEIVDNLSGDEDHRLVIQLVEIDS